MSKGSTHDLILGAIGLNKLPGYSVQRKKSTQGYVSTNYIEYASIIRNLIDS